MARPKWLSRHLWRLSSAPTARRADVDALRLQIGWLQSQAARQAATLRGAEFKVFSQWGEDGVIQHLISRVQIADTTFVELGVEDYSESNTRFLLTQDNWRGAIIDAGQAHTEFLNTSDLRWRHDIEPVQAFIDRDNVNDLIRGAGMEGDIGLLSIDLDGNDYWILDAIDVVSPRILITEFNSTFGPEAAVSIPYDPGFQRLEAHHSSLFQGASLAALNHLAGQKGFALVGCGSNGANAFFVRRDVLGDLEPQSVADAYVASRFRESRDASGALTYVGPHEERRSLIAELPLIDVMTGEQTTVGALDSYKLK
jgi:hypothetical protein